MKASICMSTYNKNDFLPNVLYSISKQKISFPFEVCIIDDHSDIDPYPIIEEFLITKNIPVKYKRLDKYEGFMTAYDLVLKSSSDDCDCMILQSSDVIYLQDNIVEELCKNLSPKIFTLLEVYNLQIQKDFYLNFEHNSNLLLKNKESLPRKIKKQLTYYEGKKRPDKWFFFLGGILKKDLQKNYAVCDMIFDKNLHENLMKPKFLDLYALHQNHIHQKYICPLTKTCKLCSRTKLKNTKAKKQKKKG